MSELPDTKAEIDLPIVRTWADYCRESEDARPVIEETSDIPAAEPPAARTPDDEQPWTTEQLARLDKAVRESR